MPDETNKVPEWAKIWLDMDVATWLHEQADRHYGGNVELALNETLRAVKARMTNPGDLWAMSRHQVQSRLRSGHAVQRRTED